MLTIDYEKSNKDLQNDMVVTPLGYHEIVDIDSSYKLPELLTNYTQPNYIVFDGMGIDLENTGSTFYKANDYVGFLSGDVSDEQCNTHGSSGIRFFRKYGIGLYGSITFQFYGNCCAEVFVVIRNSATTESIYEEYHTVDGEIWKWNIPDYLQGFNCSIEFTFTKTVLPNQFIKISHITFGEIFVFDKFKNVELLEEINVLSDDLPMNSLNYSVVLKAPMEFESDESMNVYSNGRYYGTFYLDDAERIAENTYSIKAYNLINTLENTEFLNWPSTTVGANDFMQEINNITNIEIQTNVDLGKYSVFGHIPINTFRYALCGFAFACCLMIDASRGDKINLVTVPSTISSIITTENKRIIGEATYSKKQTVTSAIYTYPEGFTFQPIELYPKNSADDETLYRFDEPPIEIESIQGNSITKETESSLNHIVFKAENDDVTLNGWKISFGNKTLFIYNPDIIFNSKTKVNELEFKQFNLRGCITDDEGVITSLVEQKSKDILRFMQSRGTVKAKIRLRNEKVGDLIQIETAYDGVKTGIITSMNIHFGYEDTADIEVLEWQNG